MILSLLDKLNASRLILASGSPRRKQILEGIGLKVDVIPSSFEENLEPSAFPTLDAFVLETCYQKALDVADKLTGRGESFELIIAADTIVALDNKVYGKPITEDGAREMLKKLSGKAHKVLTGVTLIWNGFAVNESKAFNSAFLQEFCEETNVHLANLTDDIIDSYVKTQEPLDKAGGYGIQGIGGSLVEKIEGDYYNVVGFPLHRFCKTLEQHYATTGFQK